MRAAAFSCLAMVLALIPSSHGQADGRKLADPGREQIEAWIVQLTGSELGQALQAWHQLKACYPHSRPALFEALKSEDPALRQRIVGILCATRDQRNNEVFERLARADRSAWIRISALKYLSRFPGYAIAELLGERLLWEKNKLNRLTILRIAARVGERSAVGPILQSLKRSPDKVFASRAYRTLRTLTGASLPAELGPWQLWWDAYREKRELRAAS